MIVILQTSVDSPLWLVSFIRKGLAAVSQTLRITAKLCWKTNVPFRKVVLYRYKLKRVSIITCMHWEKVYLLVASYISLNLNYMHFNSYFQIGKVQHMAPNFAFEKCSMFPKLFVFMFHIFYPNSTIFMRLLENIYFKFVYCFCLMFSEVLN